MEKFHLDPARWHELAAQRGPWRAMLRTGVTPPEFHPQPTPPPPDQRVQRIQPRYSVEATQRQRPCDQRGATPQSAHTL